MWARICLWGRARTHLQVNQVRFGVRGEARRTLCCPVSAGGGKVTRPGGGGWGEGSTCIQVYCGTPLPFIAVPADLDLAMSDRIRRPVVPFVGRPALPPSCCFPPSSPPGSPAMPCQGPSPTPTIVRPNDSARPAEGTPTRTPTPTLSVRILVSSTTFSSTAPLPQG